MSFRSTVIIIILLAGIAGAYFLFFPNPTDNNTEDDKPRILETYDLPRKDILKIRLSYADKAYKTLTLERNTDNIWQLTTPFIAYAESDKVNELIDDFVNKRIKQVLEVSEYDKYGLQNPSIKVELWKDHDSSPKTFHIGKKGINFSVYTKEISEGHIFLIESSALDDMLKAPTDLRDKSVIKFEPDAITEIEFQKPYRIVCQKDGLNWKITHPIAMTADSEEINYILSELHALQVSSYEMDGEDVKTALNQYGLDTPKIKLTLKDGKRTYGLDIGNTVTASKEQENDETQLVYVKSVHQGGIYTVHNDIVRVLKKSVFDLRDKRILDFQREDTTKFVIQHGKQKLIGIKLHEDIWELDGSIKSIADPQAISDLLFGVDSLQAVSFVTDSSNQLALYGLESPIIQVAFSIRGEIKPAILLIGNDAKDNTVYVKTNNSDQITRVKRDLIDKIAQAETWLRNKDIFNFNIDDPTRLTLKYGDVSFTCQRLGTNWRLTQPVQENANNTEVETLLYELIDLKAAEFVKQNHNLQDTTTGLNTPQLQLTVALRTQKVLTLQIGNVETSGHYYSRLKHQPDSLFLLDSKVIPKLKTKLEWLRKREVE